MVKITVVTPSFNQAEFLEETLRSVLSQREEIHEYFVLDGGSSDGSADLIRRYAEAGGIDWWVSEKDAGQPDAIARGFARATGDVLCWLNSDDVFLPGALAQVRRAFEQHPEWDVLTGYHVRTDQEGRIVRFYRTPGESRLKFRWGISRVCQQTCFFRRSAYEAVGGLKLDLHYCMDTDLWFRLHAAGYRWGHIPAFLAGFRWHAGAKTTALGDKMAAEHARVCAPYPQFAASAASTVATNLYRFGRILTGQYPLALGQTLRHSHAPLSKIFGDWNVTPAASVQSSRGATETSARGGA